MIVFIHNEKEHKGEAGRRLIYKALSFYTAGSVKETEILRGEHGKPYFPHVPVEFSVSHTAGLWICLMHGSEMGPLGIDAQEHRPVDYERLAERFFTEEEAAYVKEQGKQGFYRIWTRKEAYGKYLGTGLSREGWLDRISVVEDGKLIERHVSGAMFMEIDMEGKAALGKWEIGCVACAKQKEELWIRIID